MPKTWQKSSQVLICGTVVAALLLTGCNSNTAAAPAQKEGAVEKKEAALSGARNTPIVAAAKKVGPAVVGITNKAYIRDFFNRVQLRDRGTGSGVIYDSQRGYIATNNHVVEGASEIIVSLNDGRSVKGKVLGADAATDLAVVQIESKNLPQAVFGDSDSLQVGEPAIAIGNPLGLEFRGSVTAGVISALNRTINLGERKFNLIQTDAAISPGNSGGALVNADGEVVGINSAKIVVGGVEGIGFAIPINTAKPILDELANRGRIARPYLGVSLMDKEVAERYGFDIDLHGGIFLVKVLVNGPAYKAGLRSGDIILSFDGKKVSRNQELTEELAKHKVGDKVSLTVWHQGAEATRTLVLEEVPKNYGD